MKSKEQEIGVPNVFGEAVFDEFFVLVLVEAHEDCVIAGIGSGLEVEHHSLPFPSSSSNNSTLLGFPIEGLRERKKGRNFGGKLKRD